MKIKNNLGRVYTVLNDFEQAKKCIDESMVLSKELDIKESLKRSYSYLGDMYERKQDFEKAAEYYKKYIYLSEELLNSQITTVRLK